MLPTSAGLFYNNTFTTVGGVDYISVIWYKQNPALSKAVNGDLYKCITGTFVLAVYNLTKTNKMYTCIIIIALINLNVVSFNM